MLEHLLDKIPTTTFDRYSEFWFRNNFIDFLSVAGAWLFCPQNFYQYTLRFKSDPYDSSDFLVGDFFGFISLRLEFSFTKVDYVWSLKLVLIQHSPRLLLVKIKCQLQNTCKIELWNKSWGWPFILILLFFVENMYDIILYRFIC